MLAKSEHDNERCWIPLEEDSQLGSHKVLTSLGGKFTYGSPWGVDFPLRKINSWILIG